MSFILDALRKSEREKMMGTLAENPALGGSEHGELFNATPAPAKKSHNLLWLLVGSGLTATGFGWFFLSPSEQVPVEPDRAVAAIAGKRLEQPGEQAKRGVAVDTTVPPAPSNRSAPVPAVATTTAHEPVQKKPAPPAAAPPSRPTVAKPSIATPVQPNGPANLETRQAPGTAPRGHAAVAQRPALPTRMVPLEQTRTTPQIPLPPQEEAGPIDMIPTSQTDGPRVTSRVVGIIDGCLIWTNEVFQHPKVRLADVTCPKPRSKAGRAARRFTTRVAFTRTVTIAFWSEAEPGVLKADVYTPDGRLLNRDLVRSGLAYADGDRFQLDEQTARRNGVGMWRNPGAWLKSR